MLDDIQSFFWQTIEKTVNDPAIQNYLNNTKEFDLMRFITAGDNQLLVQSNLKALNSIRGKNHYLN